MSRPVLLADGRPALRAVDGTPLLADASGHCAECCDGGGGPGGECCDESIWHCGWANDTNRTMTVSGAASATIGYGLTSPDPYTLAWSFVAADTANFPDRGQGRRCDPSADAIDVQHQTDGVIYDEFAELVVSAWNRNRNDISQARDDTGDWFGPSDGVAGPFWYVQIGVNSNVLGSSIELWANTATGAWMGRRSGAVSVVGGTASWPEFSVSIGQAVCSRCDVDFAFRREVRTGDGSVREFTQASGLLRAVINNFQPCAPLATGGGPDPNVTAFMARDPLRREGCCG